MNASDARVGILRTGARSVHVKSNGIIRVVGQPFLEDLHCVLDLPKRAMRERQQPARIRIVWPQRDDLREAERGLARPILRVQQDAKVVVRIRVFGIDTNRRPIGSLGFGQFASCSEHHAEIAVRIRVARIEGNRTAICGDRIIQPQPLLQDDPQVAVPIRPLGLELEAPLDQRNRVVTPSPLMGEHA